MNKGLNVYEEVKLRRRWFGQQGDSEIFNDETGEGRTKIFEFRKLKRMPMLTRMTWSTVLTGMVGT